MALPTSTVALLTQNPALYSCQHRRFKTRREPHLCPPTRSPQNQVLREALFEVDDPQLLLAFFATQPRRTRSAAAHSSAYLLTGGAPRGLKRRAGPRSAEPAAASKKRVVNANVVTASATAVANTEAAARKRVKVKQQVVDEGGKGSSGS